MLVVETVEVLDLALSSTISFVKRNRKAMTWRAGGARAVFVHLPRLQPQPSISSHHTWGTSSPIEQEACQPKAIVQFNPSCSEFNHNHKRSTVLNHSQKNRELTITPQTINVVLPPTTNNNIIMSMINTSFDNNTSLVWFLACPRDPGRIHSTDVMAQNGNPLCRHHAGNMYLYRLVFEAVYEHANDLQNDQVIRRLMARNILQKVGRRGGRIIGRTKWKTWKVVGDNLSERWVSFVLKEAAEKYLAVVDAVAT